MDFTLIRGSGRNRKTAVVPAWQAKSQRENRERVAEDFKALVTRPQTFGNHSGELA
jgi:hypothetical protein